MAGSIQVNVRHDLARLARDLDDFGKKQVPFAAARALTQVAVGIKTDVTAAEPDRFNKPSRFTLAGLGVKTASKANLRAEVFMKPIQSGYLAWQETGGTEPPKKVAIVIPVDIRRNAAGKLPRGALQRLKSDPNVFVGQVRLPSGHEIGGFWRRLPNHRLQLLVQFTAEARYKPRFGYSEIAVTRIKLDMQPALRRMMDVAIKTALR